MPEKFLTADRIDQIKGLPFLRDDDAPRAEMKLWENISSGLSCYYAPFEYLNLEARLILVGITPGRTQMNCALNAARSAILAVAPIEDAIRRVKCEGSFSGAMRPNIVNMLNRLGYQHRLGVTCASSLWSANDHLVHFSSLVKFPVFLGGRDYNGNPKAHKDNDLKRMLQEHFLSDMAALPHDALLLPLGDTVLEVLAILKERGEIAQELMEFEGQYVAPPHPSGANAESIALLMEPNYPNEMDYADRMRRDYLVREPWKKKGGKPQSEAKYNAARVARWKAMLFVRRAYGLQ